MVTILTLILLAFAQQDQQQREQAQGQVVDKMESSEGIGMYLIDGEGRALYTLVKEEHEEVAEGEEGESAEEGEKAEGTEGVSAEAVSCMGQCAEVWLPFLTNGEPTAGVDQVDPSLLGITQREDGSMQVAYNAYPLYHFSKDQESSDINGQGVESFGGTWCLVSPQGEEIETGGMIPSDGAEGEEGEQAQDDQQDNQ